MLCAWHFPNLVVFNLVVCNFYAEALFCALSRSFALFCEHLRSFACFCERPRSERLRLRTADMPLLPHITLLFETPVWPQLPLKVCRVPASPQCNWMTLPSSHSPSLPTPVGV